MSKEREILQKMAGEANQMPTHVPLLIETQNLLAQPEQPNEPVAWKGRTYGNLHHVDCGNSIPLYTSPPKREPLSDDEICNLYYNVNGAIHKFARVIEKAHGIGAEL